MNQNLTQITMLLDRSGSMSVVRDATIAGFNEFIEGQKNATGDAKVTLIQFDSENPYEVAFEDRPVKEAPKLTSTTFLPRGGTPLRDALGMTITSLGAKLEKVNEADRPGKVVVVVMTDGMENCSREYKSPRIAEMIKHQREKYGWQFVFLGANQDAILTGESLGISKDSSITYAANDDATKNVMRSTSANLASYRSGEVSNISYLHQDRVDAMVGEQDKVSK
jgi:Mg-chelatase subunit ChlD